MVILNKETTKRGILAFFTTETGKKVTAFGAGATTIGLFLGNFLPHSLCLNFYKDFVQCYENGLPRPVQEKVLQRIEKAIDKLEVSQHERKFIKPFSVYGFDLFQAGSTKFKFGSLLGIPINFGYDSAADIKRSDILFRDETINWSSQGGTLLQDAIVLQEDEQIFGICKAILQNQSYRALYNAIYPSASFLMVYTVGHYLNMSLQLLARPLSLRLVMYTILGLFGFGVWSFLKDFSEVTKDAEIDKQLSALGPEFINAGVRYYDKILKKNMALRELLKDDTYTAKGNVNYLIRQKSLPLTVRKSFFEEKWKDLQKSQENVEEFTN